MNNLPEWLQEKVQRELAVHKLGDLQRAAEDLMGRYRETGKRAGLVGGAFLTSALHRAAYVGYRMPATFAVIARVFEELKDKWGGELESLLDLGAGPGTASFAAAAVLPHLKRCELLEQDGELIALGKRLGGDLPMAWVRGDLVSSELPPCDGVVLSYVLNELVRPEAILHKAWDAAQRVLILIEPGTPYGFQSILQARNYFLNTEAHLIAPCPHRNACPLAQLGEWCHFATRVERTRSHRLLKMGDLGYEDEKYAYLILAKSPGSSYAGRLVAQPEKHAGHLKLCLCTSSGIQTPTYSKKQGELYKQTRKLEWGDSLSQLHA